MDQFRWIDHTQPGRLVQGTMMLYISAFFNVFNLFLGARFAGLFLVLALLQAGGGWGIANEKKLGYWAGCAGAVLSVLVDIYFLTDNAVFGLIGLGISIWIATLVLHESSRGYARIWFK